MSKIIIQLHGGLVQEVFITGEGEPDKAIIIDEDIDGLSEEDLTIYTSEDGTEGETCIHTQRIIALPPSSDMARALNAFESIVCECGQRHPLGTTWCTCGRDLNKSKETDHE